MKSIDTLCVVLAVFSGLVLIALIGLTFFDVVLRYIFSAPIFGARDLLEMGMVLVISLGFPFTWRIGGHIVVDLLPDYGLKWLTVFRDLIVRFIGIVIFGLLTWRAWLRADDAELFNEATNMLEVPFQPLFWVLSAAAAFHTVVLCAESIFLVVGKSFEHHMAWASMGDESSSDN